MTEIKVSCELNADECLWYIRVEIGGRPFFFVAADTVDIAAEIAEDIREARGRVIWEGCDG